MRELDESTGDELELLDGTAEAAVRWGCELPVRLRLMHSHWLHRGEGVVHLRPRRFDDRAVHFVVSGSSDATSSCHRVPQHLWTKPWRELCAMAPTAFDRLILPQGPVADLIVRMLAKFERSDLLHTHLARTGELLFELPRNGLSFEL